MRALLRDAEDQTRIAFEVEEAIYDPDQQKIFLYSASGTCYGVDRIQAALHERDYFPGGHERVRKSAEFLCASHI